MDPDTSDSINFTEQEIQEELARLGYRNVPHEKLREFKKGNILVCILFCYNSCMMMIIKMKLY